MPRPVVTVLDDYAGAARRLADWSMVEQRAVLTILSDPLGAGELHEKLAGTDIICLTRERTAITGELIRALPRLRTIITTGQRTANLDIDAARSAGIAIVATPLAYTEAAAHDVAELAIGLILSLSRRIVEGARLIAGGRWQKGLGRSLRGQTLGLLGFGRTGRAMVPLATALGMDVLAWSPRLDEAGAFQGGARHQPREQLIRSADIISLHMPASPETVGSFGRQEFAQMRPNAILVNTSRASIVDEGELIKALVAERIAGAAIDVFPTEPLPLDSILRKAPRLLMTPHLGYATEATMRAFYGAISSTLGRVLDGRESPDHRSG
jgi:phosphoglycerate dehydrogenase-like enzyme